MDIIIYILIGLIWYLFGAFFFIYWWTKDYDFIVGDLTLCLILSLLGPLNIIIGWLIHGDKIINSTKVLIKERKK